MAPGTEFARDFCAGIGPLQLGVVLVFTYILSCKVAEWCKATVSHKSQDGWCGLQSHVMKKLFFSFIFSICRLFNMINVLIN